MGGCNGVSPVLVRINPCYSRCPHGPAASHPLLSWRDSLVVSAAEAAEIRSGPTFQHAAAVCDGRSAVGKGPMGGPSGSEHLEDR